MNDHIKVVENTLRELTAVKKGTLAKIKDLTHTGNTDELRKNMDLYRDIISKINYLQRKNYGSNYTPEDTVTFAATPQDAFSEFAKFAPTEVYANVEMQAEQQRIGRKEASHLAALPLAEENIMRRFRSIPE